MQTVRGTFQGTGAALKLCLGFIPSYFKMWNISDATNLYQILEWVQGFRSTAKGFDGSQALITATGIAGSDLTAGAGVSVYEGGDTTDGTESYLGADAEPNKFDKGAGDPIDTWTLDTVGNKTGHWNAVCSTTYPDAVGVGSIIKIDAGKGAESRVITALTSNGEQADEVTLDVAIASGKITFLGGTYTFVQMASGLVAPKGLSIAETAAFNVDTEMVAFEAVRD